MMQLFNIIKNLITSLIGYIMTLIPVTPSNNSLNSTILAKIKQFNHPMGPNSNGGMIYANTSEENIQIANLIIKYSTSSVTPAIICAFIQGESMFSLKAIDPNLKSLPAGSTPEQAALHQDLGIFQFDVQELYNGILKGLTIAEIQAKAYNADWAIPQGVLEIQGLLTWANKFDSALTALGFVRPYASVDILAFDAYNSGKTGAGVESILNYTNKLIINQSAMPALISVATPKEISLTTKLVSLRIKNTGKLFAYGTSVADRVAIYQKAFNGLS